MRAALLILLFCAACARNEPATMVHGNIIDHQRQPVGNFKEKRTCEIAQGLLHKQSLGVTQYYACESAKAEK